MRVQMLDLDLLDARPDARAVDADKVRAIAASVGDVGLLNPVRVRPAPGADGRFEIVAGMHRVAAYRALGLVEIEADVVDSGDLFAELAMIDENLCRAELGPADRARQVARRKQIYEELHPETQHGSPGVSRQVGDTRERSDAERFTADTAAATGTSERTVQREAERGEKISPDVLALVRGTELDTGTYLDRLKRFAPDQQRMIVERDLEAMAEGDRRNPNAHRATMHRRVEPDDSLNYFPTPPWATRALMEVVLMGDQRIIPANCSAWEPACGEGHISGVLLEYFGHVEASDIFDYGVIDASGEGRCPPAWIGTQDFLDAKGVEGAEWPDWIITNPPFGAVTLPFVLKALSLARDGVAMLVRQQWLEGVARFRDLFAVHPPAVIGQFVERVPMHKGRWDPTGDTLTSYVWIVWDKHTVTRPGDTRFLWIPDGQREALTRDDDVARFTAHPVLPATKAEPSGILAGGENEAQQGHESYARMARPGKSSTAARMDVLDNSTEGGAPAQPLDQAAASTPPAGSQAPPVEADNQIRGDVADSGEVGAGTPAAAPAAGATEPASAVADSSNLNAVIRAGYARNAPIAELEAETGLSAGAITSRAKRMKLGDRARQRAAVAEANRRRGQSAQGGAA